MADFEASLWTCRVAGLAGGAAGVLAEEELRRAAGFRHAGALARFLAGRVLARRVLGARLGLPPPAVPLLVSPNGRPVVAGGPDFSLAHSGELVVLAVGIACGVGVDVERLRPLPEAERIARTHLPPAEMAAFLGLAPAGRVEGFFRAWTRSEARFKLAGDAGAAAFIHEWVPASGYRAALAVTVPCPVRHEPCPDPAP